MSDVVETAKICKHGFEEVATTHRAGRQHIYSVTESTKLDKKPVRLKYS